MTGEAPGQKRLLTLTREENGKIKSYSYTSKNQIKRREVSSGAGFNLLFGNTVGLIQQSINSQGPHSLEKQATPQGNHYILTIEQPMLGKWIYHIRESDWLVIKKINISDDGTTTTTEYTDIVVNEGFSNDIFDSALPEDVPIIDE